jgi:hypothetical protein
MESYQPDYWVSVMAQGASGSTQVKIEMSARPGKSQP